MLQNMNNYADNNITFTHNLESKFADSFVNKETLELWSNQSSKSVEDIKNENNVRFQKIEEMIINLTDQVTKGQVKLDKNNEEMSKNSSFYDNFTKEMKIYEEKLSKLQQTINTKTSFLIEKYETLGNSVSLSLAEVINLTYDI